MHSKSQEETLDIWLWLIFFLNNCWPRFVIFSFLKACLCLNLPPSIATAQRSHTCMNTSSTSPFLLCPASRYPPGQKPHLPPFFLFLCLLGRTQYLMVLYFFFCCFLQQTIFIFCFSGHFFLGSQAKFVLMRTVWICCRTWWLQVILIWSPFLLF